MHSRRTTNTWETALHLAARVQHRDAVALLLAGGARDDLEVCDSAGLTPLAVACVGRWVHRSSGVWELEDIVSTEMAGWQSGAADIVAELLLHKASVEVLAADGCSLIESVRAAGQVRKNRICPFLQCRCVVLLFHVVDLMKEACGVGCRHSCSAC